MILAIVQGEKPSLRPPGHEAFVRGFDEDLWALANHCWAFEAGERPKMKVVSAQLREAMYRIQRISESFIIIVRINWLLTVFEVSFDVELHLRYRNLGHCISWK